MASTARPTKPRRANQRADVVDAALSLFARQGYRSTGVRDIADALGIGAPSVYSHVRSKGDLLSEIVLRTLDGVLAAQQEAIESTPGVEQQLHRVAEAQVRYFAQHPREAVVTTQDFSLVEGDDLDLVMSKRHAYQDRMEGLLVRGCREGVFAVDNTKIASFAIIEMCEAVPTWFHADGEVSIAQVAHLYGEFAVRIAGRH